MIVTDVVKNNTEEKTTKQNDDTIDNSVETKQPDLSKAKIPVPEVSDQSAKVRILTFNKF